MEIAILLIIDLLFTVPFGIIPGGELIAAFGGAVVAIFVSMIIKTILCNKLAKSSELQNHTTLKLIYLSLLEFIIALLITFIFGGLNRVCFDNGCRTVSVGEGFMTKTLIFGFILIPLMIENIVFIGFAKRRLRKG